MSVEEIAAYHKKNGFAMSVEDLVFVRDYFRKEGRNPTETEVKVIDTYWSDHCRHTTFATEIRNVEICSDNPHIGKAYDLYKDLFAEFNASREDKYPCLMDIATIAVKKLKKEGRLVRTEQYGKGLSDRMVRMCHAKCRAALDQAVQECTRWHKMGLPAYTM